MVNAELFTNQSIIVRTSKTKSLLPSLYKREEFPLFGIFFLPSAGKEGLEEIFTTICLFNYGLFSKFESRNVDFALLFHNPQSKIRNQRVRGMTLIEVIMVMVIIGILAATLIPRFDFATSSRASVDGAAYMIASDIRYAQEYAMANRVSKSVIFTSGSSIYTFNPAHNMDSSGRLPSGVTIGTTVMFTFNSLGEPIVGGSGSVTVSGGGQTKTISVVNYTGKVNIS